MWNTYLLGGTPGLEHLILEWNVSVPPEGGANPPLKRFYTSPAVDHSLLLPTSCTLLSRGKQYGVWFVSVHLIIFHIIHPPMRSHP
jgi:hypothetical protein